MAKYEKAVTVIRPEVVAQVGVLAGMGQNLTEAWEHFRGLDKAAYEEALQACWEKGMNWGHRTALLIYYAQDRYPTTEEWATRMTELLGKSRRTIFDYRRAAEVLLRGGLVRISALKRLDIYELEALGGLSELQLDGFLAANPQPELLTVTEIKDKVRRILGREPAKSLCGPSAQPGQLTLPGWEALLAAPLGEPLEEALRLGAQCKRVAQVAARLSEADFAEMLAGLDEERRALVAARQTTTTTA